MNVSADIEGLYKAMKGWGTDEKKLISVLAAKDPLEMAAIRAQYQQRYHQDLVEHLKKECGGDFGDAITHLARGPLLGDVYALKGAVKGSVIRECKIRIHRRCPLTVRPIQIWNQGDHLERSLGWQNQR
jgi:annexin A7/11